MHSPLKNESPAKPAPLLRLRRTWTKVGSTGEVAFVFQGRLTPLLNPKDHDSIADAVADLGRPNEIGKMFSGFQRYLYDEESMWDFFPCLNSL